MAVTIGHASIDENGRGRNGAAGDQTGREVCTRPYYVKPWIAVYRPKSSIIADRMAHAMEQACANDNIGYDMNQRTTLFALAQAANWNLSKVKTKCETDCSALVAVCANAAGLPISKDMYTGNERACLMGTGQFTEYTDSSHIASDMYLKRGDVLLAPSHTAIVLTNGSGVAGGVTPTTFPTSKKKVTAENSATEFKESLAGTYKVTTKTDPLSLRTGAGEKFAKLASLPKGTKVKNYGYFSNAGGVKWLYVQATVNGVQYTGFCSKTYLTKVK